MGTHGRHPWFDAFPALSAELTSLLERTGDERQSDLYAWCLMPDHLHVLVRDPDVVEFVRLLKGRATALARRHERGRRLWQRSFHDHGLRQGEAVPQVAQYVFENPVRAGLVASPSEYRWSGSSVWPGWRAFY